MPWQEEKQAPPGAGEGVAPAREEVHEPLAYSADDFRREIRRLRRKRVVGVVVGAIVAVLVVLVVIGVVVFRLPSSLQAVASDDMTPVLMKGQVVLTQEASKPAAGDVVAYRDASGSVAFKRVVAVSGEWVNVSSDGKVVVSDAALDSGSDVGALEGDSSIIATRQVPNDACFVMADTDSSAIEALYNTDLYVSYNKIIGRATQRVWPLTVIGPVS